jgi:hypothetical protein
MSARRVSGRFAARNISMSDAGFSGAAGSDVRVRVDRDGFVVEPSAEASVEASSGAEPSVASAWAAR